MADVVERMEGEFVRAPSGTEDNPNRQTLDEQVLMQSVDRSRPPPNQQKPTADEKAKALDLNPLLQIPKGMQEM